MRNEPSTEPPYFVVYPENEKLISGEISFIQHGQNKQWAAIFWIISAPIVGVAFWLYFSHIDSQSIGWIVLTLGITALFVIAFLEAGISQLSKAQHQPQLENGQFLDGQIVRSELYGYSRGRETGFILKATYRFETPKGKSVERTVEVQRYDLLHRANKRYPGIHDIRPSEEDYKRLQEFAPPPNTPVKIRYVNDSLFRVM